jgi:hypothetical protein
MTKNLKQMISRIETILKLNETHVFTIVIVLLSFINFNIYGQDWFSRLLRLDLYASHNLYFLLILFIISVIYAVVLLNRDEIKEISNAIKKIVFVIILYLAAGFYIGIVHEQNFIDAKRVWFYFSTPMLVLLSVFLLFRSNKRIVVLLHILFAIAIIHSFFNATIHYKIDTDIASVYPLFNISPDAAKAIAPSYLARFSIPGLGPSGLPSMLAALILIGIYFLKNSAGKIEYFFYLTATAFLFDNIVMTSNRSAVVSLVCGIIFLLVKGHMRVRDKTFIIIPIFIIISLFRGGSFLRLLLTVNQFLPDMGRIDLIQDLITRANSTGYAIADPGDGNYEMRFYYILDTLKIIKDNFIHGFGYTNIILSQQVKFNGGGGHNLYLVLMAQGGIVIMIPYVIIVCMVLVNALNLTKKDIHSKNLGIVLSSVMISYIVDQIFASGYFHFYYIWYGLVLAWARNCEMERRAAAKLS